MRVLGIDLGIASCGWAVVEPEGEARRIIGAGVRCFDAPLVDKTGEPKSAVRRTARGQRRVIRRRRQRMHNVRAILHRFEILSGVGSDALREAMRRAQLRGDGHALSPWRLRAMAHDRLLDDDELSIVVGHIARHRGFRSNSKRDAGANAADETSKMKKAMEQTREGLAKYRSFGEMIESDPKFAERKRNRDKDYSHTPKRSDLEDELRFIFAAQRRFGNPRATLELEAEIAAAAFTQRPLQDSEGKVGPCPFEPGEKRTAKRAPSFEAVPVPVPARESASDGRPRGTWVDARGNRARGARLRRTEERHVQDAPKAARSRSQRPFRRRVARDKEVLDVVARAGAAAAGTSALREALGDGAVERSGQDAGKARPRRGSADLPRRHRPHSAAACKEIGLTPLVIGGAWQSRAEAGAFNSFTGAAHISAKAARNIIPGLREGLVYSDACARVGYDHSARRRRVARSDQQPGDAARVRRGDQADSRRRAGVRVRSIAFTSSWRATSARAPRSGRKLTKGIEDRNADKDRKRKQASELLGREISDDELMRFELATEQQFQLRLLRQTRSRPTDSAPTTRAIRSTISCHGPASATTRT